MAILRVRARTVDMLGRQQIAGIPTAIHELLKNAHDAYANSAVIDYYHHTNTFVLRDNGSGMSPSDFETRWLTLGTESKVGSTAVKAPRVPHGMTKRAILGEKGVGRLAIAAIGPQVLVVTRAKNSRVVACFINWTFFELPGIDLNEIEVATTELTLSEVKNNDFWSPLIGETRRQLKRFSNKTDRKKLELIQKQLEEFEIDPVEYGSSEGPSLTKDSCGTQFFIQPVDPIVESDLLLETKEIGEPSAIEKYLAGFSSSWIPHMGRAPIRIAFFEHKEDATRTDLIHPESFFTLADFQSSDHTIEGRFDKFGNFKGSVGVYDKKSIKVAYPHKSERKRQTECGPFSVKFAYLQGNSSESSVPRKLYSELDRKLKRFGGLYIYRNAIRVLPYGDSDYDFLDIEKRRSKGAGYYFFSYRRIFGGVSISVEQNAKLSDKAGREGFRHNSAYREFRQLLINLLNEVAKDFFRESGKYSDTYTKIKDKLKRQADLTAQREKYRKAELKEFQGRIDDFFRSLNRSEPQQDIDRVKKIIGEKAKQLEDIPKSQLQDAALSLERDFLASVNDLNSKYEIKSPEEIGLSEALFKQYNAYLSEFEEINKGYVKPLRKWFKSTYNNALKHGRQRSIDERLVGKRIVEEVRNDFDKQFHEREKEALGFLRDYQREMRDRIDNLSKSFEKEVSDITESFLSNVRKKVSRQKQVVLREGTLLQLEEVAERHNKDLRLLSSDLQELVRGDAVRGAFPSELISALESKIDALEDELDKGLELMELGMALGVIQHEFMNSIHEVRTGIERLKPWADANPKLNDLYRHLNIGFEHLIGYFQLFDPLSRRINPSRTRIVGASIEKYLLNVFGSSLKTNDIKLLVSGAFRQFSVRGYTSTLYPVFVNLVDNAIYWLSNYTEEKPIIKLDVHPEGLVIKDNGPGIEPRYKTQIFDLGFSRKTGGRGLGLNISRKLLQKEGHDLQILPNSEKSGAAFVVKLQSKE